MRRTIAVVAVGSAILGTLCFCEHWDRAGWTLLAMGWLVTLADVAWLRKRRR